MISNMGTTHFREILQNLMNEEKANAEQKRISANVTTLKIKPNLLHKTLQFITP